MLSHGKACTHRRSRCRASCDAAGQPPAGGVLRGCRLHRLSRSGLRFMCSNPSQLSGLVLDAKPCPSDPCATQRRRPASGSVRSAPAVLAADQLRPWLDRLSMARAVFELSHGRGPSDDGDPLCGTEPVRAGLVRRAMQWRWSSARAHVDKIPDGLTDLKALSGVHRNWRAMLRRGLAAGDLTPEQVAVIEARGRTGRPLGDDAFVERLEAKTGRHLRRRKPGPKPRAQAN